MPREPRKRTAIIMFSNAQKAASPIKKKQQMTYWNCPSWSCSTGCVIMAT